MNTLYTVKQLVIEVRLADVLERVGRYYRQRDGCDEQRIARIAGAYELMRSLVADDNEDGMTLWIWVYVFSDEDSCSISPTPRVKDYRESDYAQREGIRQVFDVCAVDRLYDGDIRYSYAGLSQRGPETYRRYLGLYIEDETLEGFSKETLLAHLLWDFCA